MNDPNGQGKKKPYYRIQSEGRMDCKEFIDWMCNSETGANPANIKAALQQLSQFLPIALGKGYSVQLDGIGTFSIGLGVKKHKEIEDIDSEKPERNASSIEISDVKFRCSKDLKRNVMSHCHLERGETCKLHHSKYTPQVRHQMALQHIEQNGFMKQSEYVTFTGLSRTMASRELKQLCNDPDSGITKKGRGPAIIYVKKQQNSM